MDPRGLRAVDVGEVEIGCFNEVSLLQFDSVFSRPTGGFDGGPYGDGTKQDHDQRQGSLPVRSGGCAVSGSGLWQRCDSPEGEGEDSRPAPGAVDA